MNEIKALFGKRKKSPVEIVSRLVVELKEYEELLKSGPEILTRLREDVTKTGFVPPPVSFNFVAFLH